LLLKICAASSGLRCLCRSVFDLSNLNLLGLDSILSPWDISTGNVVTLDNPVLGMPKYRQKTKPS